ncbi:MAG: hypothetical protein KDG55_24130, partial [Rhodocyclaceae bacterium]|nr:hypothetical protein [Rhodocyclaceae bacterium]
NGNLVQPAIACWEQGCMPAKQPLSRQRFSVVPRGVKYHIHDAFNVSVCRFQGTDIDTETACKRRPHLFAIQDFVPLQSE